MDLLRFEEVELQAGKSVKDGLTPVRALYRVTQANKRTSHGKTYEWESMQDAASSPSLQEEIAIGALFGYLDHPPDAYDAMGQNIGSNPYSNPRIFRIESLWADSEEKSVKAWVQYLPSRLGLYWSGQIRKGNYPKVSMVSELKCDPNNYCQVLAIKNFDQVEVPAMASAVLLH